MEPARSSRTPRLGARGKALVPGAIILLIALGSTLFLFSHAHRFPGDVATHWGADGAPDQWQSFNSAVITALVGMVLVPLFMIAVGIALKATTSMGGFAVGMSGFLAFLMVGSLWIQRDGNTSEPRIGPLLLLGLGAGVVLGVLVGVMLAKVGEPDKRGDGPAPTPAMPLSGSADLEWTGRTRVAGGAVVFIVILTLALIGVAAVIAIQDPWMGLFLGLVGLLVPASLGLAAAGIRIDERGVQTRRLGRIALVNVPLHEITGAGTREIHALGDFGGWGYRASLDGSSQGLVLASGEALVVQRGERKDMVIVCDDATTAARTVATLIGHPPDSNR